MNATRIFTPEGTEPDANAVEQFETCMADERAVAGALMADHHLGYSMPIGAVIAYDNAISPSGVGFDIGCGNKAVLLDLTADELAPDLAGVMDRIQADIAFGVGRSNPAPVDHNLFDWNAGTLAKLDELAGGRQPLSQKARDQLGTVGAGNHYVDVLADDQGRVWVANHFGSRGLGHTIATGFLNLAANLPFDARAAEREEPTVLSLDGDLGNFYLDAMRLAGDYAHAGRDIVTDEVLAILGNPPVLEEVHNHHNFAWFEDHLWVVRKGATPLTDLPAYIGGSMLDGAVIVRGRGEFVNPSGYGPYIAVEDIGALRSAPHGAGRQMSRTQAAGRWKKVVEQRTNPAGETYPFKRRVRSGDGLIDWPAVQTDLAVRGIELRGAAADEAPGVYKNLDAVIAAHPNIEVIHRLRPLGVVMAGDDTFDPYKD